MQLSSILPADQLLPEELSTEVERELLEKIGFLHFASEVVSSGMQDPSMERFTDFLNQIDQEGYPFLNIARRLNIRSSPMLCQEIRSVRHPIHKTGGELSVLYDINDPLNPCNGVMVNTLGQDSAMLWAQLAFGHLEPSTKSSPVAVAPILLHKDQRPRIRFHNNRATVFSRYCGPNLNHINGIRIQGIGQYVWNEDDELYLPQDLRSNLMNQVDTIKQKLKLLAIRHGHDHNGNFTYELVKADYYQKELMAGKTVNTINFDRNNWSFDLRNAIFHPHDWEVIVRLIDFDKAELES